MHKKKSALYIYLFKVLLVFIAIITSYYIVTDYYAKRQEELAFNSAENAMNYLADIIKEQGEITVVGKFMFAGETLLNNNPDRIDAFHRHTGFGCTIFRENIRINTSAKAKGADKTAIGTSANKEITQKVFKKGETFKGVTSTLGKDWLIIYEPLYNNSKKIVGMIAVFLEYNTFMASLTKFKIMVALVSLFFAVFVQGLLFQAYHGSKKLRFTRNEVLQKNETLVLQKVELEKSQSNFKQISNTIDDTFYLYNISFKKYEYISPNCIDIMGANQSFFYSGKNHTSLVVHEDDRAKLKTANTKVDNGESYDIEYRVVINDEIRWVRERSFPIKDKNGLVTKNSGICSDITDKKIIEGKLITSESNFKQISNTIDDTFYLYNISVKKYEYMSPNCIDILGVSQDFFYSDIYHIEEYDNFIYKEDLPLLKEAYFKVDNGEPYDIEYRVVINDEIRWIRERSFPIKDKYGNVTKNSGVCSDITEKKGSESKIVSLLEEIRLKEDTLLKITESQDLVFWLSSWETNNLDYISPSFERLFERSIESIINNSNSWYDNIHPEDKERVKEAYITNVPKGTYDIEFRLVFKDGRIKWVRERAFPVQPVNGIFGKVSGISEDITDKKLMEKELQLSYNSTKKLAKIGVEITENLSVVEIVEHVYQRITQLMDATSFAVGIIKKDELIFPLFIDGDKKYENVTYSLDDNILATICVHKNLDIIIGDIEQDYQKYTDQPLTTTKGENPISIIYLPLKFKGKIIGVITVQSFIKNAYSENQIDLLRNLSIFIANALENAQLNESLEEKVEVRTKEVVLQKTMLEKNYTNAKILAQIGLDISSSLKFDEIFDRLYQNVNKLLDAEVFGVRIYNREENVIEYKYDIESGILEDVIEIPFSDKDNYTVWCIENNKEILINDNNKEYKNYVSEIKVPAGKMPHSLIFCPMVVGNTVLGAITVQSFEKNAYTESDMDIIRTLSFYTGIALANAKLYETLEFKVATRTLELSRKNKEITDSINYAKRIQDAMRTSQEDRLTLLPNSFVFYRPKDILSGDFYRIDKVKTNSGTDLVSFIVGDCTGHGVPGASLAMLCNSILKHSTTNSSINSPSEALDYAKEQLGVFFQSSDGKMIDDGMDIAFCTLNKKTNMLYFAGANSNCIIVRKEQVIVLKGDRRHVGYQEDKTLFTKHTFELEKNDCIYLTSDGIIDQFGGPNNRKFMRKRFFDLLKSEHKNSMEEQRTAIKKEFETWKGETEQTDDICILGLRIT